MVRIGFSIMIAALLLLRLATDAFAGGAVAGEVRYDGEPPVLSHRPVTIDTAVCGPEAVGEEHLLGKRGALRNAVVFVKGGVSGAGAFPEPSGGFVLDQKGCRFEPHVLIMAPGASLQIQNSDRLHHSLRTVSRTNPPLSVAQSKAADSVTLRIPYPEIVEVRCAIHDWMRAWVIVAEHPYYVVTDAQGRFRIDDIPAGDYTLAVWHEFLGFEYKRIEVKEGETLKVDFRLRRTGAFPTPQEPFISRRAGRLDVNVLPITTMW